MTRYRRLLQIALPFAILLVGGVILVALVKSKEPPEKKAARHVGALVATEAIRSGDHPVTVTGTGTVQAARHISVTPQVGGRVVRLGTDFVAGGFIPKGHLLLEIESEDYRLGVKRSRADLAKARLNLASTESQARIARAEWERMHGSDAPPPNPLVVYVPQLANAKAAVTAAEAALRQRQMDVARTRITAPFNCRIRSKSVDLGQVAVVGQPVAIISDTDTAEIIVPVPLADLRWLTVPRDSSTPGTAAEVMLSVDGRQYTWSGRLVRSLGEVDPASRMIRLVIKVDDPYGHRTSERQPLALAEGLFVDVALSGRTLANVFTIPTGALRHPDAVWIMTEDQTLDIRPVTVVRRTREAVVVTGDLIDGMDLVMTQLTGAAQGMQLRTITGGS